MRIGFFTDRYYPQVDGVAESVRLFATQLYKNGHEVFVICPQSPHHYVEEDDFQILRLPSFQSIWYEDYRDTFPWTPRQNKLVRNLQLDVIHIHTPAQIGTLGLKLALEDNIPIVGTYHTDIEQYARVYKMITVGVIAEAILGPILVGKPALYKTLIRDYRQMFYKKSGKLNKKMLISIIRSCYNQYDAVIVPSKKIYKKLLSYHISSPIKVLPTGINPAAFETDPNIIPHNIREKLSGKKVLCYVGRLGAEKNIKLILEVQKTLLDSGLKTHLLFVGDGPFAKEMLSTITKLELKNDVTLMGNIEHHKLGAYYQASDIFVFPSMTDTQGLVLNEAGLFGLPIIYCDDEISELLVNGKTALLAQPNSQSLAETLKKLLQNQQLYEQLSKNILKKAKKINIVTQTAKLEEIYQSVLKS